MGLRTKRPAIKIYDQYKRNDKRAFLYLTSLVTFNLKRLKKGGDRVVRWCWVNFQCRGVLLLRIKIGQGPTARLIGSGGGGVV